MLGLEAHRGGVRLSAQLGSPRMAGYFKQTSRGYLLPVGYQGLGTVRLKGEGGMNLEISWNVSSIFGNLISFASYTVCVKWVELGWLLVW